MREIGWTNNMLIVSHIRDYYSFEFLGLKDNYSEYSFKKAHENPSVGIILCKTKEDNIVEISLNRSASPTIISQYETKLIDKELLRNKLNEIFSSNLDEE